jgi:hypothetical protein
MYIYLASSTEPVVTFEMSTLMEQADEIFSHFYLFAQTIQDL